MCGVSDRRGPVRIWAGEAVDPLHMLDHEDHGMMARFDVVR